MANQVKFRVLRITKDLQSAMAAQRVRRGETNAAVIANAVSDKLPALVASLESLGFGQSSGKKQPARLPILEETLSALSVASSRVKVPASALLLLCLTSATGATGKATTIKTEKAPRKPRTTKGAK